MITCLDLGLIWQLKDKWEIGILTGFAGSWSSRKYVNDLDVEPGKVERTFLLSITKDFWLFLRSRFNLKFLRISFWFFVFWDRSSRLQAFTNDQERRSKVQAILSYPFDKLYHLEQRASTRGQSVSNYLF